MAKEIKLTRGFMALVDDEDFEYLSQFKWHYNKGYAVHHDHKSDNFILMHRVIQERKLGRSLTKSERVDHRDRNRANNVRENIRLATQSQNIANTSKYAAKRSSRFKGVSWHGEKCQWIGQITANETHFYLGSYSSEEDAAKVYDQMALLCFGEFASLNFPDQWLQTAYEVYLLNLLKQRTIQRLLCTNNDCEPIRLLSNLS